MCIPVLKPTWNMMYELCSQLLEGSKINHVFIYNIIEINQDLYLHCGNLSCLKHLKILLRAGGDRPTCIRSDDT